MPLIFNPMLPFNFEEKDDIRIFVKDEEGNDVDITEYVAALNSKLADKVNTFQGATNGNKVMITDPQGNITTVEGVVMNISEREKLASLTNPVLLKGIINSYEALYQVENPQVGWCYYVRFAKGENDNIYEEYVYTADHGWELFGHFNASSIPQYFGGTATEIDNTFHVNLKYDPDVFEVDANNRLKLKDLSYVAKCKTLAEINALSVNDIFHWQGANDQNIVVLDPNGTQTYIRFGYFYKKGDNAIQRINKERESNAKEIVAGENISITEDSQNDRITINANYDNEEWGIGKNGSNQLKINGKFVKQVEDLDAYTDAPDGEIVEYIGKTNSNYTNGHFYKRIAGSSTAEYEKITIPPNKTYITYHFPDNTEETGYELSNDLSTDFGKWVTSSISSVTSSDDGTLTDTTKYNLFIDIAKVGDTIVYNNTNVGIIESLIVVLSGENSSTHQYLPKIGNLYYIISSSAKQASQDYMQLCDEYNIQYGQYNKVNFSVYGVNAVINDKHYTIIKGSNQSGISNTYSYVLINNNGYKIYLETASLSFPDYLVHNVATEIRKVNVYGINNNGEEDLSSFTSALQENYWHNNEHYNSPTIATVGTTTEEITMTVPILYDEYGQLIDDIVVIPPRWQRVDVQLHNVVMMYLYNNIASYYPLVMCTEENGNLYEPQQPDSPNPAHRVDYEDNVFYYATNTNKVYTWSELDQTIAEVTNSVIISGDVNTLYVDTLSNQSYRYNGSEFVKLGNNDKADEYPTITEAQTRTNIEQGDSVTTIWSKIKKFFADLKAVAFSGSYNDLSNKPSVVSTSANGLAPQVTDTSKFLKGDGTWATPSGTTYSAGQGLVKNGSTFKIGSGTNVHLSKQAAKSGDYILITINDYNAWMLSFKVRFYGDYKCDEYIISGYNYGSSYWYSPSVVLISSSGENRDVKFGYTALTHLWVAIPNANYYGVDVLDVVCGYQQVNSYDGLFTLTETSSLSGTTQTTITVSPLAKKSDIPSITGKVDKSGDSMSGTLTFTTANAINYDANNGNISMIRFKTGDADGHGIIIGGGGLTVIGAGESATTVAAQTSSGGSETMQVCSDANIEFYTNCQSGFSSAKKSYLDTSGNMYINGSQVRTGTVAIANGGTGATTRLGALQNLTSENVGTNAQYFLTITTNWAKGGYTSVADAKTVLGLGSAAYVNADTAASNNTIVKRTANGFINATYFNQSSSAETPTSSSYIMYCNSDGYLRKSSIANIKSLVDTNTWRPLGTGASDACAGNDSRLSNSRPASDVYAWAKASSKPSYTASEVGAQSATALTSSKTYNYGSNYCYAYKYGRVVYLSIILYNNGTGAGITLDATYRPLKISYTFGIQTDSATDGWITATSNNSIITVGTDGVVQAKKSFAGTIYGNITYISAS